MDSLRASPGYPPPTKTPNLESENELAGKTSKAEPRSDDANSGKPLMHRVASPVLSSDDSPFTTPPQSPPVYLSEGHSSSDDSTYTTPTSSPVHKQDELDPVPELVEQFDLHSFIETEAPSKEEPGIHRRPKKKAKRKAKAKKAAGSTTTQPSVKKKLCAQPDDEIPSPGGLKAHDASSGASPVQLQQTEGLDASAVPEGSQQLQEVGTTSIETKKTVNIRRVVVPEHSEILIKVKKMADICSILLKVLGVIQSRFTEVKDNQNCLQVWLSPEFTAFHSETAELVERCTSFLESEENKAFLETRKEKIKKAISPADRGYYFNCMISVHYFIAEYHFPQGVLPQVANNQLILQNIDSLCSPDLKHRDILTSNLLLAVKSFMISAHHCKHMLRIASLKIDCPKQKLSQISEKLKAADLSVFLPLSNLMTTSRRVLDQIEAISTTGSKEGFDEKRRQLEKNIEHIMTSFSQSDVAKDFYVFLQSDVGELEMITDQFERLCHRTIAIILAKAPTISISDTLKKINELAKRQKKQDPKDSIDMATSDLKHICLYMAEISIKRIRTIVTSSNASLTLIKKHDEFKLSVECMKSLKEAWHILFGASGDIKFSETSKQLRETLSYAVTAQHKALDNIKARSAAADKLAQRIKAEIDAKKKLEEHKEEAKVSTYLERAVISYAKQQAEQAQAVPQKETPLFEISILENREHLARGVSLLKTISDDISKLGECIKCFKTVENRKPENATTEQKAMALYGLYSLHLTFAKNSLKEKCRPSMVFLSDYHDKLLKDEAPPYSEGRDFYPNLIQYKVGIGDFTTRFNFAQKTLDQLIDLTFFSDNDLINDQDLLESIREGQLQCMRLTLEVHSFSKRLPEICEARKEKFKGKKRTAPDPSPVSIIAPDIGSLLKDIKAITDTLSPSQKYLEVKTALSQQL